MFKLKKREDNNNKFDDTIPGRVASKQYTFGKGHKLEACHAQFIKSIQPIAIHTGHLPPLPKQRDNCNRQEHILFKKRLTSLLNII